MPIDPQQVEVVNTSAITIAAGDPFAFEDIVFSAVPNPGDTIELLNALTATDDVFTFVAGASSGFNVHIGVSIATAMANLVSVMTGLDDVFTFTNPTATSLRLAATQPGTDGNANQLVVTSAVITLANGTSDGFFTGGSAELATESTLGTIRGLLTHGQDAGSGAGSIPVVPPVGFTQKISAAALPLPTGAATEATLAGINNKLLFSNTGVQVVLAGGGYALETGGNLATIASNTGTLAGRVPNNPSTDRTTAGGPFSVRLSDGGVFYKATTPSDTQPVSIASMPSTPVTGTFWQSTQPASIADGSDATEGAKADTAATDSTSSWSVVSILKGLWARLTTINSTLGTPFQAGGSIANTTFGATQATAASLNATVVTTGGVAIAKDSSLSTINTTLGTPFQAGGSIGNTAFTANAGTNLNTSQLATSANLTAGTAKAQQVDASGNVTPSGDVVGRSIFVAAGDGTTTAVVDPTFKAFRSTSRPPEALGFYSWQGITGAYAGLAANTPLFSFRWGDATRLCLILRVQVLVFTSTSATTAGINERQLIIARGFSASDTGGTAATLTGNNQKMRTSQGTSLVTDLRIGNPLTAGTRTLDSAPIASAVGWSGLLSTGVVIGACGGSPVGAARSTEGGIEWVNLWDATNGQQHAITLVQNEGAVVRIGAGQPAGATNQTMVKIDWAEVNAY